MKLLISLTAALSIAYNTAVEAESTPGGPNATTCPEQFHGVKLHQDATQCQRFDTDFPVSLVYFVNDTPNSLVAFYLAHYPDLSAKKPINHRTLLVSKDGQRRVIVSPDNKGAQVDVLLMQDQKPPSI